MQINFKRDKSPINVEPQIIENPKNLLNEMWYNHRIIASKHASTIFFWRAESGIWNLEKVVLGHFILLRGIFVATGHFKETFILRDRECIPLLPLDARLTFWNSFCSGIIFFCYLPLIQFILTVLKTFWFLTFYPPCFSISHYILLKYHSCNLIKRNILKRLFIIISHFFNFW